MHYRHGRKEGGGGGVAHGGGGFVFVGDGRHPIDRGTRGGAATCPQSVTPPLEAPEAVVPEHNPERIHDCLHGVSAAVQRLVVGRPVARRKAFRFRGGWAWSMA